MVIRAFVPGVARLQALIEPDGRSWTSNGAARAISSRPCLPAKGAASPTGSAPRTTAKRGNFSTPMPSARFSVLSTIISWWKGPTAALRTPRRACDHPRRRRRRSASPFGRRKPSASRWWAISINGTGAATPCASGSIAGSGSFSRRASGKEPSTNTRSSARAEISLPLKADPFGFRQRDAAIDGFDRRADGQLHLGRRRAHGLAADVRMPGARPMSIYEVHLGSWRRKVDNGFLTYDELAEQLIPYVGGYGLHPYRAVARL